MEIIDKFVDKEDDAINKYINEDKIVFLNITANWCPTCKINEITTFERKKMLKYFINI